MQLCVCVLASIGMNDLIASTDLTSEFIASHTQNLQSSADSQCLGHPGWRVQRVGWFHYRIYLIRDQIYLCWQRPCANKCYLKTSTDLSAKEAHLKQQEFSFRFSDLSGFCSEGHKNSCPISASIDRNQFSNLVWWFWRLPATNLSV